MHNDIHLLIVGGDLRQLEVIRQLSEKVEHIYLVGFDNKPFPYPNVQCLPINEIPYSQIDYILFPIPGVPKNGEVESHFSSTPFMITEEMIQQTPADCLLLSGVETPFLKALSKKTNRRLIPIFARDDVAVLNSIPTAEGALMLAIQHTSTTIHNANVLILGFGRVGMTIARLFSAVGANVSVCARKKEDFARIIEMGIQPLSFDNLQHIIHKQTVCINTVPHLVLTKDVLSKVNIDCLIIDLASHPGGTDFAYAKKKKINAIWSLGLPAKVAPKTAGQVIATILLEIIEEENR